MAGLFSLIDNFRLNVVRLRRPLGFVNILLYSGRWETKDILSGANPGCGTGGFVADVGWDPVRPGPLVSFPSHFRRWLILWSLLGLGSRDSRPYESFEYRTTIDS